MRVDQLNAGKNMWVKISDLRRNFKLCFYRIDFTRISMDENNGKTII